MLVALRELGRGDLVEADAFRVLDVAEVADAAVAEARRRAPDAAITLQRRPAPVHGWEPGIRILLDNLLGNALAHGRDAPGRAEIAVAVGAGGGRVLITVDDRGPGIAPADRQEVFRRFHRGPASTGSGLGLTLVAQQAALHGGSAELGEAPGGPGPRCTVRLPAEDPAREGELPCPAGLVDGHRRAITEFPQRAFLASGAYRNPTSRPYVTEATAMRNAIFNRGAGSRRPRLAATAVLTVTAPSAFADSTPSPAATAKAPTGDGAKGICKREPKTEKRIERALNRLGRGSRPRWVRWPGCSSGRTTRRRRATPRSPPTSTTNSPTARAW